CHRFVGLSGVHGTQTLTARSVGRPSHGRGRRTVGMGDAGRRSTIPARSRRNPDMLNPYRCPESAPPPASVTMTTTTPDATLPRRARLSDRWPTAVAIIASAGAIAVMVLFDNEVRYFGPSVATMAGIYLLAYAIGRPWTAW